MHCKKLAQQSICYDEPLARHATTNTRPALVGFRRFEFNKTSMIANDGGIAGCNYFLLKNQTHLVSSDVYNNNISHSWPKTHSGTLIQFLFWKTKKKCGSVIDSTMSLSEESDIWCVLKLELETLGKKWNKFDVSKIVFSLRKTPIFLTYRGWVAKLNHFITQITFEYDLTMF